MKTGKNCNNVCTGKSSEAYISPSLIVLVLSDLFLDKYPTLEQFCWRRLLNCKR